MPSYDFRILLETVEGNKTSYYSSSFVNTDTDGFVISSSIIYDRITGSLSCSYQNTLNFSGSDIDVSKTFKDSNVLSASLSGSLHTGSINFDAPIDEYDRLLRYKFIGEKVCTTLGLPSNQWVYVDQLRFPSDEEANIFQGNANLGNVFISDTLTFANNANINSDMPFYIDTGSDRYIKFIDTRDTGQVSLRLGYDKDTDSFEINAASGSTFNISNVNEMDVDQLNVVSLTTVTSSTSTDINTSFENLIVTGSVTVSGSDSDEPLLNVLGDVSASQLRVNGASQFGGDMNVSGNVTATSFTTTQITISTGSTGFGDTNNDTHIFTGSVTINATGSTNPGLTVSSSAVNVVGEITASGNISSSGKLFALGADFADQNIVNIGSVIADTFAFDGDTSTNIALSAGTATFNQAGIVGTTANFSSHITASGNISSSGDILTSETVSGSILHAGTLDALNATDAAATAIIAQIADDAISGNKIEGGTIGSITISQLAGALNVNNQTITNVDINSGNIDNTVIGEATPTHGTFNQLTATGVITASAGISSSNVLIPTEGFIQFGSVDTRISSSFGGGAAESLYISSDNNMTLHADNNIILDTVKKIGIGTDSPGSKVEVIGDISASGDMMMTSITASGDITASGYISASSFAGDGAGLTGVTAEWDGTHSGSSQITGSLIISGSTENEPLLNVLGNLSITGTGSFTGGIDLEDNEVLNIGTGNDLQIYHNGSHSFIKDSGTGNLILLTNLFQVKNAANNETMIQATQDGVVKLNHNNSTKFETTATGIDVTGNISASLTSTGSFGHGFFDSKVGIGDIDPPQALSVVGNILLQPNDETEAFIHANNKFALSSDSDILIVADSNDTAGLSANDIILGAGSAVNTNTSRDFGFADAYPDSVPRNEFMRIKGDSGNVGIGTTGPSASLHISSSNDPNLILEDPNGSSILRFRRTDQEKNFDISMEGNDLRFTPTDTDGSQNVLIGVNAGSNKIDSRLGVGTGTPRKMLDVSGSIIVEGSITASGNLTLDGNATIAGNIDLEGDIDINGTTNLDNIDVDGTSNFADDITLAEGKSIIFDSTDTFIKSNTDNPEDLEIAADDDIILKPDDDVLIAAGGTSYAIFDGANSRLGINTTSPVNTLHVSGANGTEAVIEGASAGEAKVLAVRNNLANDTTDDSVSIQFSPDARQDNAARIVVGKDSDFSSGANIDTNMQFAVVRNNASKEVMRLTSDERVGIGEATPLEKLHLKEGNLRIETATNTIQSIKFTEVDQERASIEFDPTSNNDLSIKTLDNSSTQVDRLTIRHSQLDTQIGIGNAEPTETLQVEGNISGSGNLDIVSITGSKLVSVSGSLTSTSSFGDGRIFRSLRIGAASSSANENYALHISESHGFSRGIKVETKGVADSNSQVLIEGNTGGSSPGLATALELRSNIDYRARGIIHSTATGSEAERWFAGVSYTGGGYQIGFSDAASNNLPHYKVSSSLFIKEDGAVGIGTTVPTNQLEVEGNISSSGDIQQNSTATGSFGSVHTSGNIGIATTSPTVPLQVEGDISSSGTLRISSILDANDAGASSNLSVDAQAVLNIGTSQADDINIGRTDQIALNTKIFAGSSTPTLDIVNKGAHFRHPITASADISGSGTGSFTGGGIFGSRVGIGTTTPITELEIHSANSEAYHYPLALRNPYNSETNLDYGVGIKFHLDDASDNKFGSIAYEAQTSYANIGNLNFYVDQQDNTTPIATITTTGLGIGTSNIDDDLHISASDVAVIKLESAGDGNYNGSRIKFSNGIVESGSKTSYFWMNAGRGTDGSATFGLQRRGSGSASDDDGTYHGNILLYRDGNHAQAGWTFAAPTGTGSSGVTNRFFISSSGNIGMGTTSPIAPLHIQSNVNALSDTDEAENYHLLLRNPANDTGEGTGLAFLTSATTDDVGASLIYKRTDTQAKGELQFYVKTNTNSDGAMTQAMTIDDSGNVGIGTTSPTVPLQVEGNISGGNAAGSMLLDLKSAVSNTAHDAGIRFYKQDTLKGSVGYNSGTDTVNVNYGGFDNTHLNIDSNGKVGIGTASPSEILDVVGNIKARDKISSTTFESGFAGSGFRIETGSAGGTSFTVDDLTVRGTMSVFELLIHQIRATNGSLFVSNTGKLLTASLSSVDNHYSMSFDTGSGYGHSFRVGDLIRAQRFVPSGNGSGSQVFKSDLTVISSSGGGTGSLVAVLSASSDEQHPTSQSAPQIGYEYVRIGNTTDADRQGSIYLTADDDNAPFIDVVDTITSHSHFNTSGRVKVRMGKLTGITTADPSLGTLDNYGFYASGSAYLEGSINASSGKIGGFAIDSSSISSSNSKLVLLDSGVISGSQVDFTGGTIGGFELSSTKLSSGELFTISASSANGEIFISSSNFKVSTAGHITASAGEIGGFTIGATTLVAGNLTIDSTNEQIKLGSGAAASANSGIFLDSDGTFNLATDANNYIRKNSSELEIKSTNVDVSGSNVNIQAPSFTMGVKGKGGQFISGSSGEIEISSSNFHLKGGNITASNVALSGSITATTGDIGGFIIDDHSLTTAGVEINDSGEDLFISSSEFKVKHTGEITGSQVLFDGGVIGGYSIDDNNIFNTNVTMSNTNGGFISLNDDAILLSGSGEGKLANGNLEFNKEGDVTIKDATLSLPITQPPSEFFDAANSKFVCLITGSEGGVDATVHYGTFESDTVISILGTGSTADINRPLKEVIFEEKAYTSGSIAASSLNFGDIIESNKPIALVDDVVNNGSEIRGPGQVVPLNFASKQFLYYNDRNHPDLFTFYSPFSSGSVTMSFAQDTSNPNDADWTLFVSGTIDSDGTLRLFGPSSGSGNDDSDKYFYKIDSTIPIVGHVQGNEENDAEDATKLFPSDTIIYNVDKDTDRKIRADLNTTISNAFVSITASQQPTAVVEAGEEVTSSMDIFTASGNFQYAASGDGVGADAVMGIGSNTIGDTYILPHAVGGVQILSGEPAIISCSQMNNDGTLTFLFGLDHRSASLSQPLGFTTGSDRNSYNDSDGRDLSPSGLYIEGTGNFALRTNANNSGDEYTPIGYRRNAITSYNQNVRYFFDPANTTTILGDRIRTGKIQSNNFDSSSNGSIINLNDGTFALGGIGSNADLLFDGDTLTISGTLSSSIGNIAGFTLEETSLFSEDLFIISASKEAGELFISSSEFKVTNKGQITASAMSMSGTIVTDDITATAGEIAGFEFTDTQINSADDRLILKSNGQITASAVSMSGTIVANKGEIGGFTIDGHSLTTDGVEINDATQDLFINTANFDVSHAGNITASNVSMSGTITADNGEVGGFSIDSSSISSSNNNLILKSSGQITASTAMIIGNSEIAGFDITNTEIESQTGTLKLKTSGQITASNAKITGDITTTNITSTSGSIGGFTMGATNLSAAELFEISASLEEGELFISSSRFKVKNDGRITASAALFDGNITSQATMSGGTIVTSQGSERVEIDGVDNKLKFITGDTDTIKFGNLGGSGGKGTEYGLSISNAESQIFISKTSSTFLATVLQGFSTMEAGSAVRSVMTLTGDTDKERDGLSSVFGEMNTNASSFDDTGIFAGVTGRVQNSGSATFRSAGVVGLNQDVMNAADAGKYFTNMPTASYGVVSIGDSFVSGALTIHGQGKKNSQMIHNGSGGVGQGLILTRDKHGSDVGGGEVLGVLGFDSLLVSESSAIMSPSYIAGYANETQNSFNKGGYLSFATSPDGRNKGVNATERMRIQADGTTEFYDDISLVDGDSSGDTLVRIYDAFDDGIIDVYQNNSVVNRIHGNGDSYFTSGNIGIGDTSPESLLHIEHTDTTTNAASNTLSDYLLLLRNNTDTTNAFAGIAFDVSTETDADSIGAAIKAVNDNATSTTHDANLTFHTNDDGDDDNTERMRITHDGKVGIGIDDPDELLTIKGGSNPKLHIINTAEDTSGIKFSDADAISTQHFELLYNSSTEDLRFKSDAVDNILYLEHDTGDVGIGTNNPICKLEIEDNPTGGTNPVVKIHNTSTDDSSISECLELRHGHNTNTDNARHISMRHNDGTFIGLIKGDPVNYGTFTGFHMSQNNLTDAQITGSWLPGMIVKSNGNIIGSGSYLSEALPEVELTTTQKDKAVMGVYTNVDAPDLWRDMDRTKGAITYNGLGEGRILVTDTNGNIETGDYICSSNRTGHGEKQDDDILHNYTVAKATQPIDFSTIEVDSDLGYKSVLVACTYHCG